MEYKPCRLMAIGKDEQWATSFVALFLAFCAFINSVSCKSAAINRHIVASTSRYNEPQQGYFINEESSIERRISADNNVVYDLLSAADLEKIVKKAERRSHRPQNQRHKRSHKRTRVQVLPAFEGQMMPHSTSVKISSGCTGTLVGPKYVLTAAHCVFKKDKKTKRKKLKVGFVQRSGKIRWKKVRRSRVHDLWVKPVKKLDKLHYDYAILELKREHGRSCMKHASAHKQMYVSTLRLSGFPTSNHGDKKMWSARCKISQVLHGSLYSHNCDVDKGMSGAAAAYRTASGTYKVIGILVANGEVYTTDKNKPISIYAVINPLTYEKRRQICKWMKAGKRCLS